jgi:ferrous iron transport protein B
VATSAYFIGVAAIILSGILLKKTRMFAGDPAPLRHGTACLSCPLRPERTAQHGRTRLELHQACGYGDLLSAIVIWFTQTYGWEARPVEAGGRGGNCVRGRALVFGEVENKDHSILGRAGSAVAPVLRAPGLRGLEAYGGHGAGLVAKEEVVNVFGIVIRHRHRRPG